MRRASARAARGPRVAPDRRLAGVVTVDAPGRGPAAEEALTHSGWESPRGRLGCRPFAWDELLWTGVESASCSEIPLASSFRAGRGRRDAADSL